MSLVDAATVSAVNGTALPFDPRADTERAEALRSFDDVVALPDDDRLLARLLARKMQQRLDGFGRLLRTAGALEDGHDVVGLLGDPVRLKAALAWETAQFDLVCRNRSFVPRGKQKRPGARLRESQLEKLRPGRHSDNANCLQLHVTPARTRRWVVRRTLSFLPPNIRVRKRADGTKEEVVAPERVDITLGTWPAMTLAQARDRALEVSRQVAEGQDPRVTETTETRTLRDVWDETLPKNAVSQGWKGGLAGPSATRYAGVFRRHIEPVLGMRPVGDITALDIEDLLTNLRGRQYAAVAVNAKWVLEKSFDHAVSRGWCSKNPALLAARSVGTLRAYHGGIKWVPVREAYEAYRRICQYGLQSPLPVTVENRSALRMIVLTAKRPGEVLGMRWDDIDPTYALWRIPWARMKNARHMVDHPEWDWGRESTAQPVVKQEPSPAPPLDTWGSHRHDLQAYPYDHERYYYQPLSLEALEILRETWRRGSRQGLVFRRALDGRSQPLSEAAMRRIMSELKLSASPHGWRKTLRTWTGTLGENKPDFEVAEMLLAHKIGTSVSKLYDHAGYAPERALLHDLWQMHLNTPPPPLLVVPTPVPTSSRN